MMQKIIIISAPSGAGKTSIVNYLLKSIPELSFSVSACSREKRKDEKEGKDYYFLGIDQFKKKISQDAFLEWEEVYEKKFYGTLKSELERIHKINKIAIFDLDVVGGLNIKQQFTKESLALFIMPPSLISLRKRLEERGTESSESLQTRLDIAEREISKHTQFDMVIINDKLNLACKEAKEAVLNFIKS